jgi:hypothetical protein
LSRAPTWTISRSARLEGGRGSWLKAQARRGDRRESYWIDVVEGTLLRGVGLGEASELSSGFATTMAIIGRRGA